MFCWNKHHEAHASLTNEHAENDENCRSSSTPLDGNFNLLLAVAPSESEAREALINLIKANKEEYYNLSDAQKSHIFNEYTEVKQCKVVGIHSSFDTVESQQCHSHLCVHWKQGTHTYYYACIIHYLPSLGQLNNLRSHTGIDMVLYATHGTTNLSLCGIIAFATKGVEGFMPTIRGMDTQ